MALSPIPLSQRFKNRKPNSRKKQIVLPGVQSSIRNEFRYRREMQKLIKEMSQRVAATLVPQLKRFESDYVADASFVILIKNSIKSVDALFKDVTPLATVMAEGMVNREAVHNTKTVERGIKSATGVDLERIIRTENLGTTLEAKVLENIDLIQSIPDQYFQKLNQIVFNNITQGTSANGIIKQIRDLTDSTMSRAKVIARDQTSKTNATISQTRQQDLGITKYIWQTSRDERVRATHRAHNGKEFEWSKPPADTGHPSNDIQCRCTARGVIDL